MNTQATIKVFWAINMETVFSVGSAPRLYVYNVDLRPAEVIIESLEMAAE
jgi:hypothetical protein